MARWSDLAHWRGPTTNKTTGGQTEVRGLVVHIADGWYEGTISWQLNPKSDVSSHFIVARDGSIAQMVDTADAAWTQRSGNGEWLSVECEGFTKENDRNPGGWERLTEAQMQAVAALLHKCHQVHNVPLQTTNSATGKGLGHHSMGADWGHKECPGRPIIAQKPAIVTRALALENGDDIVTPEDIKAIAAAVWKHPIDTIEGQGVSYSADEFPASFMAASAHFYNSLYGQQTLAKLEESRRREEAILASWKGLNTASIIEAVNARSAEDAARDEATRAAVLAEIRLIASGGASAEQIVDEIDRRLGNDEGEAHDE
jgi:hypothetical protein